MPLTREVLEASIKTNKERLQAQREALRRVQSRIETINGEGDRIIMPLQIKRNSMTDELEALGRRDVDEKIRREVQEDLEKSVRKLDVEIADHLTTYKARNRFETEKRSVIQKAIKELEAEISLDERLMKRLG